MYSGVLRYRYRNIREVDEETGEPLYWSNKDGWVAESYKALSSELSYDTYTEEEVKLHHAPIDGIPEPISTLVLFECDSGVVPVEIFDSLYPVELDLLHERLDALLWRDDWAPDTDEETIHELFRSTQYQNNYRILPTKGVFNLRV